MTRDRGLVSSLNKGLVAHDEVVGPLPRQYGSRIQVCYESN